ncbi:MAG: VWA domain-containing protein, partial [Rhodobacterales bacterium]|nr:VWA domain-containing protein [Rhodobacterales bacterium]
MTQITDSTRGMTNLSGGWFAAADAAAEAAEHDASLTPRVVILSDGQANEGIADVEALAHHAGELRKRGVVTSTVGIGDGYDEALLAAIAENGGGRLHDAERTDEIGDVLLGEIGEAMAQLADGALLVLDLPAGVRAEPLGISGAEITAGQVSLPLGGLSAGLARTAVVRLICTSGQLATTVEVRLSAT